MLRLILLMRSTFGDAAHLGAHGSTPLRVFEHIFQTGWETPSQMSRSCHLSSVRNVRDETETLLGHNTEALASSQMDHNDQKLSYEQVAHRFTIGYAQGLWCLPGA